MSSDRSHPQTQALAGELQPGQLGALWAYVAKGWRVVPLGCIMLLAICAPWLTTYNPIRVVGSNSVPPNSSFWFGTDSSGLDVYSQLIAATRTDVVMALSVVLVASGLGVALGLAFGMNESASGLRGAFARGMTRVVDFAQTLPSVIVCLIAVSFYGANIATLIIAIGLVLCPQQMRLVRTEVLRVRKEPYLDAARLAGLTEFQLTIRHVLPNCCWPALENSTVIFGVSIISMATLGFLGIGLPPPTPEWGAMISRGVSDASAGRWWAAGFPTLALMITVASVAIASKAIFPKRRGG